MRGRALLIVAMLLLEVSPSAAQTGAWLDTALARWNQAGAALPTAPPPKGTPPGDPRCASFVREPATAAERDVVAAGWSLYGPARVKGSTTVLLADAAVDGMCRPWDYQAFVFVKDDFAGTLSPAPMDSRTDGALSEVRLLSPTSIEVTFLRYVSTDPLCCPSRLTTVRYRIEQRGKVPLVVPLSVQSKPSGERRGRGR
jgi:hypothetical protein